MHLVEDEMRIWLGAETVKERAFGLIDYGIENGWHVRFPFDLVARVIPS